MTQLKVKQIVVMGHGGCGGIAASLAAADHRPVGRFIAPWVEIAAEARDEVLADATIPRKDWQEAVEHGAVGQSLANLMTFPFVRGAYERGELNMDGAWFSIGKGELHWRNPDDRRVLRRRGRRRRRRTGQQALTHRTSERLVRRRPACAHARDAPAFR